MLSAMRDSEALQAASSMAIQHHPHLVAAVAAGLTSIALEDRASKNQANTLGIT